MRCAATSQGSFLSLGLAFWPLVAEVTASPTLHMRVHLPPAAVTAAAGLAVFLNSLGELSAYDSEGGMEWQVGAAHAPKRPIRCLAWPAGCPTASPAQPVPGVPLPCNRHPSAAVRSIEARRSPPHLPSHPTCPPRRRCPARSITSARRGTLTRTRTRPTRCPRCAPCRCARTTCPPSSWRVGVPPALDDAHACRALLLHVPTLGPAGSVLAVCMRAGQGWAGACCSATQRLVAVWLWRRKPQAPTSCPSPNCAAPWVQLATRRPPL